MTIDKEVSSDISLPRIFQYIFKNRRLVILGGALGFFLVAIRVLVQPRVYRSEITVTGVDPSGSESRLIGLASQFGLADLAGQRGGGIVPTTDFIGQLTSSSAILDKILSSSVSRSGDDTGSPLITLIEPENGKGTQSISNSARILSARQKLDGMINVQKNKLTNTTTLSVTTKWPEVSKQIAETLVVELNGFFLRLRRQQAEEERRFSQERIEERQRDLREAEERLSDFLLANRQYTVSPALVVEHERLQRQVNSKSQVVTGLVQSFDEASIRATRDTPLILVISPALTPVDPVPRHLILLVLMGTVSGILASILFLLIRQPRQGEKT